MKKPSPATTNPLDAHLGFWLRFVSNQVSGRFEKLLEAHDISVTEWVAMRALYQRSDVTHAELIGALGMTKGAASKIISRLESKALAVRRLADDRAREQVLCLTETGDRLVPQLAALADDNDAFFFGHLSDAQRLELMNLMKGLVSHHQLKQVPTR
ncbi:MAG: MarR family transcriptional regulator [Methylobacter sp.]|nr:MAG: MarR family transcriptional regulator [Methylobacter sp.]